MKTILSCFLISASLCMAQPILRNEATTNQAPKAESLVNSAFPQTTNFSAYIAQGLGKSINGHKINIAQPTFSVLKTNATGWWVASGSGLTDGSLVMTIDTDSSFLAGFIQPIPWNQIQTNSDWEDFVCIGQPPGIGAILVNGVTNVFASDSFVAGVFNAPFATNFFQSTAFGFATYQFAFSVNASTSAGAGNWGSATTCSNDVAVGSNVGGSWAGNPTGNTLLGDNCAPNTTSGNSNIVVGLFTDTPVDATDRQMNIGNLLWGTGATTGRTPATGQVRVNNQLFISGTTNEIIFGSTNTAPAGTATPTKWVSVQVNGEGTVYRLPLYQ